MPRWQALQVSGRFCGCSLLFTSPGEITPAWAFFSSLLFGSPPWHFSQPTAFSLCVDMCHSAYRLVRRNGVDSLAWQFTQLLSRNSTTTSCGVNNFAVAPVPPATLRQAPRVTTDSFFIIVCLRLDQRFSTGSGRDRVAHAELRNFQQRRRNFPCRFWVKPNCIPVKKIERCSIPS